MVRDREGPKIGYQALMIPVTDDRLRTPSMAQAGLETPGFNGPAAEGMWLHYLGEDYDREKTSPYAAPARATDFSNLPPAFIQTNGLDPLRDEGIEYALALMAAGIQVELYNCPGAYHGAPPRRAHRRAGLPGLQRCARRRAQSGCADLGLLDPPREPRTTRLLDTRFPSEDRP